MLFTACTPSPADYNVLSVINKSIGPSIPQSERFIIPQSSPAVSDSGSQVSHCSTPCSKNVSNPVSIH